ncbi:2-amino-4-hydroxy-6-hydroxymethyldihydropteridine diphosphokinase [Parathermosynechococcus lividus]
MAESTDLSISPSDPPLVAIALGSNLGQPRQTLQAAVCALQQIPHITGLHCSRWYRTTPVGPPQPDYWNGCVTAFVNLSPLALLHQLQAIEQQFGRERHQRWGPRTLDLDLLFYGDTIVNTPELTLPHPELANRPFVLVPLAEIAPQWRHPILTDTIATLQARLGVAGIKAVASADAPETMFVTAHNSDPRGSHLHCVPDERLLHS